MGERARSEPGGAWPFVGRAEELDQARRAVAQRGGAVVLGNAGVGKSRFADEVLGADRARWHRIVASSGIGAVPFGAWSQVLPRSWDGAVDDAAAWRALAEHLQAPDGSIHLVVDDAVVTCTPSPRDARVTTEVDSFCDVIYKFSRHPNPLERSSRC